jgi:hypothetical protein
MTLQATFVLVDVVTKSLRLSVPPAGLAEFKMTYQVSRHRSAAGNLVVNRITGLREAR